MFRVMNTPTYSPEELTRLELQIARRADRLDRVYGVLPGHATEHWAQAEEEVWESFTAELDVDVDHHRLPAGMHAGL